jgi:hypothetical protein
MNVLALLLILSVPSSWKAIAPGLEYQTMPLGSATAHIVRIDPGKAQLVFALRSKTGGDARTVSQWVREQSLAVAINAGMFATNGTSNVGYLVDDDHINHKAFNRYQSVLVFGPKHSDLPSAQLLDLDAPGAKDVIAQYRSAVQNLRLIKAPGVSVWSKNGRAWSEAAVAQDKQGRLLFLFTREGLEMAQWTRLLLASGLDVVRAMHVEGGPEASLSIHTKALELDLCGSFETNFNANDDNLRQWPIPNVLGVRLGAP